MSLSPELHDDAAGGDPPERTALPGEDAADPAPRATLGTPHRATTVREWLGGRPLPREFALLFGLALPAVVLVQNLWRVRSFTVDDSYISYRFARNFAHGLGLVYNEGERIEGYTNFLWTLLLGLGIKVGIDPEVFAKVFGSLFAFGGLTATYLLAQRLRPYRTAPCLATWLLSTTVVFSGYAVFGLETSMFVFFVLAGTLLFLRETGDAMRGPKRRASAPTPHGFPWSGVVFGLAGLTRPEAPMYIGILMLFLGRRFFGRQNLVRGAVFVAPIALHMLWRHGYYGTWLPNTLTAKTGNTSGQVSAGWLYVQNYLGHAGPVVWMALGGFGLGIAQRRRDILALATIALAVGGYVVLVGGDWMPFFRFMAPFEPFCFLLVDLGGRAVLDRRERAPTWALAMFAIGVGIGREANLKDAQRTFLDKEKHFWDRAAGGTARWFVNHGVPGEVAIGDIGYVGYVTDYPILDLLGLVDPVIAKLPGGYTQKLGPGFADHFFEKAPTYALIISSNIDCQHPSVPGSQVLYRDRRFSPNYHVEGKVPLDAGFAWCIFARNAPGPPRPPGK